jgi:hypothetical protein
LHRNVILEVIRLVGPKWEKGYPILFVSTKMKMSKKRQGKGWRRPSHSKHCSYAFVYVFLLVQSHL